MEYRYAVDSIFFFTVAGLFLGIGGCIFMSSFKQKPRNKVCFHSGFCLIMMGVLVCFLAIISANIMNVWFEIFEIIITGLVLLFLVIMFAKIMSPEIMSSHRERDWIFDGQ
jgi:Na+/melibiose symporter-like transporter